VIGAEMIKIFFLIFASERRLSGEGQIFLKFHAALRVRAYEIPGSKTRRRAGSRSSNAQR